METVKELRKLLELDLDDFHLINNRMPDLDSVNLNSRALNAALKPITTESVPTPVKMNGVGKEPEVPKFRNQEDVAVIMRDLKSGTKTAKPFLRKGDGLKRFQPQNRTENHRRTCCPPRKVVPLMPEKSPPLRKVATEPKTVGSTKDTESYGVESEEEEVEEDPLIKETNDQIVALEQRILNLMSLKDSICSFTDMVDQNGNRNGHHPAEKETEHLNRLAQTMAKVQENLSAMNRRLEILSSSTSVSKEKLSHQAISEGRQIINSNCPNLGGLDFEHRQRYQVIVPDTEDRVVSTVMFPNGVQKLMFANGDVEIRTDTYLKRKYVCGKVKTRYSNGCEEIVYSDGRLQFKNQQGKIVFDRIIDK